MNKFYILICVCGIYVLSTVLSIFTTKLTDDDIYVSKVPRWKNIVLRLTLVISCVFTICGFYLIILNKNDD